MNAVYRLLADLRDDLEAQDAKWALIGAIAVIVYTDARTTRDVDVVVTTGDDRESESLVRDLQARGYRQDMVLDHERTGRLAMIAMLPPGSSEEGLRADLLFSFVGIESEIVRDAQTLEILPNLSVPVARIGHLLALKVYGNRLQDQIDGLHLVRAADEKEIERARQALRQIAGHNLVDFAGLESRLDAWIASASDVPSSL